MKHLAQCSALQNPDTTLTSFGKGCGGGGGDPQSAWGQPTM